MSNAERQARWRERQADLRDEQARAAAGASRDQQPELKRLRDEIAKGRGLLEQANRRIMRLQRDNAALKQRLTLLEMLGAGSTPAPAMPDDLRRELLMLTHPNQNVSPERLTAIHIKLKDWL